MATKKSKKNTPKKGKAKKILHIFFKTILILFILSILLPLLYRWVNPPITYLMVNRRVVHGYEIKKEWKSLEEISKHLPACAVAAEDNNFLGHRGFDWGAIQKAIDERETGRKRGASTISQQTAKNVFLWQGQSWVRKGAEVYFTFLIETFWSKERIMEVYLNVIEMGKGIYGAEAAAQHYFNTSAKKLSLHQSALITAAYPNPLERNPGKPSAYLKRHANRITDLTHKIGAIKFDKESVAKAKERYQKREAKRRDKIDGKILDL